MNTRWKRMYWLSLIAACSTLHPMAHANIYKWEYVDPGNPASGKRASGTPVAVGVFAGPGANLGMHLAMAYLDGYDLRNASFQDGNLTDATLVGANLPGGVFRRTKMTGADLTGATIHSIYLLGAAFYENTGLTAAQVYSTASYASGDLIGVSLIGNDLSGWNFAGQRLFGAAFTQSNLSGADFTGADVRGANFGYAPLRNRTVVTITEAQLASTASYQAGDLLGINLSKCDLTGWDFSDQKLTSANFSDATLTGAQFAGADIRSATLGPNFSAAQLQSTANYQTGDLYGVQLHGLNLTGINFAGMNLAAARFNNSILTGVVFAGATIRGASFYGTTGHGFTEAQLVSTADYQAGDLENINLIANNMAGWNFAGINLTNARLDSTRLAGADFTGAIIKNANFDFSSVGLSAEQLYSTASYQQGDLGRIRFRYNSLQGWNFSNQSLIGASFHNAKLAGADFSGAIVRGVDFSMIPPSPGSQEVFVPFQANQLYSTASYQQQDLRGIGLVGNNLAGWNFAGQNLSGAWLASDLTGCDFTGALIDGVNFSMTNLTAGQIYSTASYAQGNLRSVQFWRSSLSGLQFPGMDFSGGNFHTTSFSSTNLQDANLTNTSMEFSTFFGANLRGADARGAFSLTLPTGALADNMIHSNGEVLGLDLTGARRLLVRDYDGKYGLSSVPPLGLQIREHLLMDASSRLELRFEADAWDSVIAFDPGISVVLGGLLELKFVASVDPTSQAGRTFRIFDWTGVAPTGQLTVPDAELWDLSNLYATGEATYIGVAVVLDGDYNANGIVDAADYTVWRDTLGSMTDLAADGDASGTIDEGDYNVWKMHFGESVDTGSASGSARALPSRVAVPEPAALLLAFPTLLGALLTSAVRRPGSQR